MSVLLLLALYQCTFYFCPFYKGLGLQKTQSETSFTVTCTKSFYSESVVLLQWLVIFFSDFFSVVGTSQRLFMSSHCCRQMLILTLHKSSAPLVTLPIYKLYIPIYLSLQFSLSLLTYLAKIGVFLYWPFAPFYSLFLHFYTIEINECLT